jgi:hypothetical protein
MEESINGEPTILVDHDLATVWTPYWFRLNGELSHVGTNSFGLLKVYYDKDGKENKENHERWEWKIVASHDTGRSPTDAEVSRSYQTYQQEAYMFFKRQRLDNEYEKSR